MAGQFGPGPSPMLLSPLAVTGHAQPPLAPVASWTGLNDAAADECPNREVELRRQREAIPATADDPALVDEERGRGFRDPVGSLERAVLVADHRDGRAQRPV